MKYWLRSFLLMWLIIGQFSPGLALANEGTIGRRSSSSSQIRLVVDPQFSAQPSFEARIAPSTASNHGAQLMVLSNLPVAEYEIIPTTRDLAARVSPILYDTPNAPFRVVNLEDIVPNSLSSSLLSSSSGGCSFRPTLTLLVQPKM